MIPPSGVCRRNGSSSLRQRLQHFSNLPPQQQLRMLNRMETWEHLTPEQKQQARQIFGQMRQLPPDRQRMVTTAVRDLRAMPPDQREAVINSPRFKGMFSDQEREMMRECHASAARLRRKAGRAGRKSRFNYRFGLATKQSQKEKVM